jgi:hypothetical protein
MARPLIWGNNIFLPIFGVNQGYIHISAWGNVSQDYKPMTREEVAKKCNNQEVELHKDLVVTIGQMHLTTIEGYKSTVAFSSL